LDPRQTNNNRNSLSLELDLNPSDFSNQDYENINNESYNSNSSYPKNNINNTNLDNTINNNSNLSCLLNIDEDFPTNSNFNRNINRPVMTELKNKITNYSNYNNLDLKMPLIPQMAFTEIKIKSNNLNNFKNSKSNINNNYNGTSIYNDGNVFYGNRSGINFEK